MRRSDVDIVYRIECEAFHRPWSIDVFRDIGARGGTVLLPGHARLVAKVGERGGTVISFIVWEEALKRRVGRVLNIAVREADRGKGIGRTMLLHALDDMRKTMITRCRLETRRSNLAARRLYRSIGMTEIGTIPRYYEDEDAIQYEIIL